MSAAELEDLDASVRRNKPDHWLASRFIADPQDRADVIALYAFDHELSRALAVKEPLMAEIRLTWWSEVLEEIFGEGQVRRHPVSLALEQAVQRRLLSRELLECMIDPRFDLIGSPAHANEATEAALMALAARVLGVDALAAAQAAAAVRFGSGKRQAANLDLQNVPAKAFPAVAYATLKPGVTSELSRRITLTWAILRGRI